ncbi:MAG: hypothetical protein Q9159_002369 [Coniocarpon cinnabarinum]
MTDPKDGSPPGSPAVSDDADPIAIPKNRNLDRTASSRPTPEFGLPFRRSNASLSAFSASNPATHVLSKRASSPVVAFPSRHARADSTLSSATTLVGDIPNEYRSLIVRSFSPHIAILPSRDTEELLAQKGLSGGLLSLLRPFGESVPGKVTIRDSAGSSRSCEDFCVHFTRIRDGLESPRIRDEEKEPHLKNIASYLDQHFPDSSSRLRTGGDLDQIEEVLGKHLLYSSSEDTADLEEKDGEKSLPKSPYTSTYPLLYLRRLLSGLPLTQHETFSHPVACVLAVSSRSQDPIEELRQLSGSTRLGEEKLPGWVNGEYLRYHVLVHDEEHDDTQRSSQLFEQMKRHFGLHCHLLRLRSTQCVPSDDDCVRLPICEWQSAAEELAEIQRRESMDDFDADTGPCVYESDAAAVRSLVRELTTQSVIPSMERLCMTWNDQIVSRRRGISGRFLSFSKKWTFGSGGRTLSSPFGSSSTATSPTSPNASTAPSNPNSNFDAIRGTYPPDSPEHLMRKLADYAFMLRDYRLAQSVYDMLRSDYASDKAWKQQAGAMEFTAITALLTGTPPSKPKLPENAPDALLESAAVIYSTKCLDPFAALRTLTVGAELLQLRAAASPIKLISAGSTSSVQVTTDDAARCFARAIDMQFPGAVGYALLCERVAMCFVSRSGQGSRAWGARRRNAAFWNVLAAERWLQLERDAQATECLSEVVRLYGIDNVTAAVEGVEPKGTPISGFNLAFDGLRSYVLHLRETLQQRTGTDIVILAEDQAPSEEARQAALQRIERQDIEAKSSRKSFSVEDRLEDTTSDQTRSRSISRTRERSVSFAQPEPKGEPSGFGAETDMLGPPPTPVAVADKPDIRKHRRSMSKVILGMVPETESDPLGADVRVTRPRAASKASPSGKNDSANRQ